MYARNDLAPHACKLPAFIPRASSNRICGYRHTGTSSQDYRKDQISSEYYSSLLEDGSYRITQERHRCNAMDSFLLTLVILLLIPSLSLVEEWMAVHLQVLPRPMRDPRHTESLQHCVSPAGERTD